MKILAFETSCEIASVALHIDGTVCERSLSGHANHSEHLLQCIKDLVAESGLTLANLEAIAFGAGPGAFTGLRLSCGVAQGLAMGLGLGVVPVCSLQALALQAPSERVFVVTDARMGEVYCASYMRRGDALETYAAPMCCTPEMLVLPQGQGWAGIGSGFAAYAERLAPEVTAGLLRVDALAVPRAADVALLAAGVAAAGGAVAPELAAPLYVRDKVALTTAERLARGGKA